MAGMKGRGGFQVARTMLALGLAAGLNYLISFFLTPYITETVGIEIYGFVSIAKNFVQYAQIFTVAMTAFVVRYIFVSYDRGDRLEAQSYYSSSMAGCAVIAGGIFLIMLPVIGNLERFLNIPAGAEESVKLLFVLIFFNFVMQTVAVPLGSSVYIRNRLDIKGVIQILAYAADAAVLILLFRFCEPAVWYVGVGAAASGVITVLCFAGLSKKLTPDLRFSGKAVDYRKVFLMVKNGIWDSLNSLGNTLNSGLDLIISNLMLDGTTTGQISVAKTIGSMFSGLYQLIFQAFQPNMLKAYSSGDRGYFMKELTKAVKVCGGFSNILLAGFIALGQVYYRLWMPEQDGQTLYALTVLTVITGLTGGAMFPIYYVNTLTVKNKVPCLVTIGGGVLNVAGMYVLLKCTDMGAYAVVITTAVIMIGINLFFNPVYAARALGVSAWPIYRTLLGHLASAAVMIVVFRLMASALNPSGWVGLILSAAVMAAVGVVIHGLIQGRELVKDLAGKIRNK